MQDQRLRRLGRVLRRDALIRGNNFVHRTESLQIYGYELCRQKANVILNTVVEDKQMYPSVSGADRMSAATKHSPVILLLGKRTGTTDFFDEWLAESRYFACEASDVFHALEHLSDFTLRDRPDVVFLHVDSAHTDRELMQSLVASDVGEAVVPIIDFASVAPVCRGDGNFESAMAGLANQLDKFIPINDRPSMT